MNFTLDELKMIRRAIFDRVDKLETKQFCDIPDLKAEAKHLETIADAITDKIIAIKRGEA